MTRISVAMCTFNGARFLDEQLASIAAQERLPDELVAVGVHRNDRTVGSNENSERALEPPPPVCYRQHAGQRTGRRPPVGETTDGAKRAATWVFLLDVGGQVQRRLAEHRTAFDVAAAAGALAERMVHVRFRADLPSGLLARSPGAIRELAARRYHRFSNGARSAAEDVFGAVA